ncbi:uncharacterized protein DS421_20g690130 [Arachis hypogaea]|nr:uncharacterized protein DS421_20g690130 [Arachis hypogaea]
MNVVVGFCMFSGSSLLFWAENWVKIGSKIAPSEFCRLCRSRMSRDRVIHADASFTFFPATRSRHPHLRVACAFPFRAVA